MTAAPCLRRHELDAFIATAFAQELRSPLHLQGMTVSYNIHISPHCVISLSMLAIS